MRHLQRLAGRGAWGVADQALSSLTNFGLSVIVAHSVSSSEFGAFALAFAIYGTSLGASQALVAQPLAIRFSHCSLAEWRRGAQWGSGAAIVAGSAIGLSCVVASVFTTGTLRGTLFVLGIMLPLLVLQDSWRYAFFALGKAHKSFLNDGAWTICEAILFAILWLRGVDSTVPFLVAWGASAAFAAGIGCLQAQMVPSPRQALAWWREQKDLIGGAFGDYLVRNGTARITIFSVAAIAGLTATASLRGANLMLTPLLVFFQGLAPVKVPEAVRLLHRRPGDFRRWTIGISVTFTGAVVAYGLLLWMLIPDFVGRALLGDTWVHAEPLILAASLSLASTTASTGAMVGLAALGATNRLFRARLFVGPFTTIGSVVGVALAGPMGALVAQVITYGLSAILYWWHFRVACEEESEAAAAGEISASDRAASQGRTVVGNAGDPVGESL